ncbi:MAG: ferredoxin-type protein NapG [Rubrivivax sp.]|nr:ferredoxin-type protein NapG [Rubrivivax sp.]
MGSSDKPGAAMDRRRFVRKSAQATAAAACGGLAWFALLTQQAQAVSPLRPPGAGAAADFAARCIKCGQCVQACPYDSIKLVKATEPGLPGTPTIVPRETPCLMCEPIYCVKACPTDALNPALTDIKQARIGLAVIDPEHCLSWLGLRCEVCFRACPVQGQAITLHTQQRGISKHAMFVPVIHAEHCTGCGICEKRCPTDVAAIRILDPASVQGKIGAHYRLGWEHQSAPESAAPAATPPIDAAVPTAPAEPAKPGKAGGLDYLNRGGPP